MESDVQRGGVSGGGRKVAATVAQTGPARVAGGPRHARALRSPRSSPQAPRTDGWVACVDRKGDPLKTHWESLLVRSQEVRGSESWLRRPRTTVGSALPGGKGRSRAQPTLRGRPTGEGRTETWTGAGVGHICAQMRDGSRRVRESIAIVALKANRDTVRCGGGCVFGWCFPPTCCQIVHTLCACERDLEFFLEVDPLRDATARRHRHRRRTTLTWFEPSPSSR